MSLGDYTSGDVPIGPAGPLPCCDSWLTLNNTPCDSSTSCGNTGAGGSSSSWSGPIMFVCVAGVIYLTLKGF